MNRDRGAAFHTGGAERNVRAQVALAVGVDGAAKREPDVVGPLKYGIASFALFCKAWVFIFYFFDFCELDICYFFDIDSLDFSRRISIFQFSIFFFFSKKSNFQAELVVPVEFRTQLALRER